MTWMKSLALLGAAALLAGCANQGAQSAYDYSALRESRPASILVLPPLNETPEVIAPAALLAQMTGPLAESGYYVIPVGVMAETFRQNGLDQAADIHQVNPARLREIFGADAALYTTVVEYGASYRVVGSVVAVRARAQLVDLRTGKVLWSGAGAAVKQSNNNGGGLIGLLISAAIEQIANSLSDAAFPVAGAASYQMLAAGRNGGLLFGPRSPHYQPE